MAHHTLHMPVTEAQIRELRAGDTVTLEDVLYGIRDATQIHMFDHGRRTKFDLRGHAVIHTAPNLRSTRGFSHRCSRRYGTSGGWLLLDCRLRGHSLYDGVCNRWLHVCVVGVGS